MLSGSGFLAALGFELLDGDPLGVEPLDVESLGVVPVVIVPVFFFDVLVLLAVNILEDLFCELLIGEGTG